MTNDQKQKFKIFSEDTLFPVSIVITLLILIFYTGTYAARFEKVEAHQAKQDEKIESIQDIKTDIAVIKTLLEAMKK